MHRYLRSIGFSKISKKKELVDLIKLGVGNPTSRNYISKDDETTYVEICKDFASSMGIAICGEYDNSNTFSYEYCYPYLRGTEISSREDISVERHAEKESYAGVCDDIKIGVTLIFYLQNMIDYLKEQEKGNIPKQNTSLTLSGLSLYGKILFPINKDETEVKRDQQATLNRNSLIAAARKGDEEAIENLTLEDIDTYTALSRKILYEDVFTLVDTYFMPYGIECDQYSILGEIEHCYMQVNEYTKEEVYILTLNCNDLLFDICINKGDLMGEPEIGRRFKGVVWMQGYINFPEQESLT